jgi:outer membrane lipoprotein-sorting protein
MHKIILLFVLFFSQLAMAQQKQMASAQVQEVKQKVQETAQKTRTIESDFFQVKEMSVMAEKITSKGKFYLKKEKLLRWEYVTPFPYLIIINNDQLLVRDEDKENRINLQSNKVFREVNNIIMGALQGTLLNDTKNYSSVILDSQGFFLCKLTPINLKIKESVGEVWLYFNKTDFTVDKLEMRESSGDYTRIVFSAKKINQPIPDEKFVLK